MNNLFSSPRFLHVMYGSVIVLFCSFFYLMHTSEKDYKQLIENEKDKSELINFQISKGCEYLYRIVANGGRRYATIFENLRQVLENKRDVDKETEALIGSFEDYLAKYPSFLQQTSIPSRMFFTEDKIKNHIQLLKSHYDTVSVKIQNEKTESKLDSLITDNINKLSSTDMRNLPANIALLTLRKQKIELALFDTKLMDYYSRTINYCGTTDDYFLAIIPENKKTTIHEKFKADIMVSNYVSYFGPNVEVTLDIDGEKIESKKGIAHFEKQYDTPGKHTFMATLRKKHIWTGEVRGFQKKYTFDVINE